MMNLINEMIVCSRIHAGSLLNFIEFNSFLKPLSNPLKSASNEFNDFKGILLNYKPNISKKKKHN